MKRFFAVILSAIMLMTFCCTVLGAEGERGETEKILLAVKERIGSTDEYESFTSDTSISGGKNSYGFHWSGEGKRLNITVNPDGIITSYNKYSDNRISERKPSINKMSADEALQKTKILFDKINPDLGEEIRIYKNESYENLFREGYSFGIQRIHNGIDVVGDNGYIQVTENAEEIESFNFNYTPNLSFESGEIISVDKAKEGYINEIGMTLRYNIGKDKGELEYVPKSEGVYISAITGNAIKPVAPDYRYFSKNEAAMDTMTSAAGKYENLSSAELKNLDHIQGLISNEDAEKRVRGESLFSVDEKIKTSHIGLYHDSYSEKYYYSLEFSHEKKAISATVDAENGDIISYSCYDNTYKSEAPERVDVAKKYVEKLASKYYKADDSKAYRLESSSKGHYVFSRYYNDIICYGNSITINLNDKDEITHYSIRHSEVELENEEGVLSHGEICNKLFENCGYKLYYYPACSKEGMDKADKALLVYDVENRNNVLGAKSGEIKNQSKEFKVGEYTDIQEHYAKEQIETLAAFGIGFEEESFRPDDYITQKEFVTLITAALIGNEPLILAKDNSAGDYYYNRAFQGKIIKEEEKNPDGTVTREMAAVFMIRALGLDGVASLHDIYVSGFSDVTSHKGHISILSGMGVVNGYDGFFEPNRELKRADAMIMLYNYLNK